MIKKVKKMFSSIKQKVNNGFEKINNKIKTSIRSYLDIKDTGGVLLASEIIKEMENGNIIIENSPKEKLTINPNSINLTLSNKLKVYKINRSYVDDIYLKEYPGVFDFDPDTRGYRPILKFDIKKHERLKSLNCYVNNNAYIDETEDTIRKNFCCDKYYLDLHKDDETLDLTIPDDGIVLYPGIHYIGSTNEKTTVNGFVPIIDGRSSIGRKGCFIHSSASLGDNGFKGTWTLHLTVTEPVKIYPNDEICQISFRTVEGDPDNPINKYKGRYYDQEGPTPSRYSWSRETCS